MSLVKKILKSDGLRKFLCWGSALYIGFVYKTSKWDVVNAHIPQKYWDQGQPFILAFWHGRILMMPYVWNKKFPIHMLISAHRDGQLIARTVSYHGIDSIEGSSSKGGAKALRNLLKIIKEGGSIGITPDGPRGPRMRATAGIVNIAKLSGVPIIPCSFGTVKRRHMKSWDRFCLAKPFTKGVIVWGDPIHVPREIKEEQIEALRLQVERSLTEVTNESDRLTFAALEGAE